MTMDLNELADRVEALAGPDREVDDAIASARADWSGDIVTLDYTASLDAAMTLIPEGYDWILGHTNSGLTIHAEVGDREQVFGATPAIALAAACLRARTKALGAVHTLEGGL